jgi:hypothetical protein
MHGNGFLTLDFDVFQRRMIAQLLRGAQPQAAEGRADIRQATVGCRGRGGHVMRWWGHVILWGGTQPGLRLVEQPQPVASGNGAAPVSPRRPRLAAGRHAPRCVAPSGPREAR